MAAPQCLLHDVLQTCLFITDAQLPARTISLGLPSPLSSGASRGHCRGWLRGRCATQTGSSLQEARGCSGRRLGTSLQRHQAVCSGNCFALFATCFPSHVQCQGRADPAEPPAPVCLYQSEHASPPHRLPPALPTPTLHPRPQVALSHKLSIAVPQGTCLFPVSLRWGSRCSSLLLEGTSPASQKSGVLWVHTQQGAG